MNWRDLLYFSKGERRALTLLLCLITTAWIILLVTDSREEATIPADAPINSSSPIPRQAAVSPDKEGNKQNPVHAEHPSYLGKKASAPNKDSYPSGNQVDRSSSTFTSRRMNYPQAEKLPPGSIVELNKADTSLLKKVPGIGSVFAARIVKYRKLLGGFSSINQLNEVYGIDKERFNAMKSWFSADTSLVIPLEVNRLPFDSLCRHPYLNYRQVSIIMQLRKQKSRLSGWENLQLVEEFTETDRKKLQPYVSFR